MRTAAAGTSHLNLTHPDCLLMQSGFEGLYYCNLYIHIYAVHMYYGVGSGASVSSSGHRQCDECAGYRSTSSTASKSYFILFIFLLLLSKRRLIRRQVRGTVVVMSSGVRIRSGSNVRLPFTVLTFNFFLYFL